MSRPDIPAGVQSAVQADHVELFPLVHMAFDPADGGDLYVAGTDFNIDYGGNTYLAARGLATMEPIAETSDEVTGIRFSMFADDNVVAETLVASFQGRPCTVLWAFYVDGVLHVDPVAWQGRMDVPEISRTAKQRTVTITAEHRMADWARPRQLMFNDADQRRIDPTDTFFVGIESMQNKEIIVFSKEVQRNAKG